MKYFFLIPFLVLLFSCETTLDEIPKPDNLLEEKKMVAVLEDLMVMEQYVQSEYPQPQLYLKIIKNSGSDVLKKHKVSFKDFDASMTYYGSRQEDMQRIYNKVLENINDKLNKL